VIEPETRRPRRKGESSLKNLRGLRASVVKTSYTIFRYWCSRPMALEPIKRNSAAAGTVSVAPPLI
jgi:hypothetical protein